MKMTSIIIIMKTTIKKQITCNYEDILVMKMTFTIMKKI